ncbi:MAG: hypothetical protein NC124_18910 [Clostridium sp.]|nr:hypothetical protein [Clostridium sp.]
MVKIKWIITDTLENVDLIEFNTEWKGIYGYFEICVNNRALGFCPDRKLFAGEEGCEDILFWLSELLDGIVQLNAGKEYEMQLLSMNLAKIHLKRNVISFMNANTGEVIWSEKIMIEEWYNEVISNIERFITEVQRVNLTLLDADLIKKLIKTRDTLDCDVC